MMHSAGAVDYTVDGANTDTNGDGNPNLITGNGDTLTINPGATISATGGDLGASFDGGGNNTLVNNGTVATTGANASGLVIENAADSVSINNGDISTDDDDALGMGLISGPQGQLVNNSRIETHGVGAHGLVISTSQDSRLTNAGTILTFGDTAYGIINYSSANAIITNNGLVKTDDDTSYALFNDESDDVIIQNTGTLITNGEGAYGIFNRMSLGVTIFNNGSISTADSQAYGIYNWESDDARVVNNGSILTAGSNAHGVYSLNSDNSTIINNGSVQLSDASAVGILSNTAVTIANSGLVFASATSSSAIELSAGNDDFTLSAGSRIQGLIDMNNGDDTVTLAHNGNDIAWRWTFENFKEASPDTLSVIGAPYVVQDGGLSGGGLGITVTVADLSREANAGAVLADLTGAMRGAVTSRIAEAWSLSDTGHGADAAMLDETGTPLGWNAWAKAFGGHQDRGSLADFGGLSTDTYHAYGGVVAGADTAFSDGVLFGAFGGVALSRLSFADASLNDTGAPDIDTDTVFGGVYGRIMSAYGFFADGTLTIGYANGDADTRLQANNLVSGGVETISGGDASGFYAASSLTLGAHVPLGQTRALLIPSMMLGQASQRRMGYSEDSSVAGAQSVDNYWATVLSTRLELAAQVEHTSRSGAIWKVMLRGGVDAVKDFSDPVELTVLGENFTVQAANDQARIGGFLGTNLTIAYNDRLSFNFDSELTLTSNGPEELGGTFNAGVLARF